MPTLSAAVAPFVLILALFPATAFDQDTTDADDLRILIEVLRGGSTDFADMEPTVRIAVREQMPAIIQFLAALGQLQSIQFERTESGADIFLYFSATVEQFGNLPDLPSGGSAFSNSTPFETECHGSLLKRVAMSRVTELPAKHCLSLDFGFAR